MSCILCGSDDEVAIAPFLEDNNKWVLYRKNGVEVIFYVRNNAILNEWQPLSIIERKHIQKHLLNNENTTVQSKLNG